MFILHILEVVKDLVNTSVCLEGYGRRALIEPIVEMHQAELHVSRVDELVQRVVCVLQDHRVQRRGGVSPNRLEKIHDEMWW
jgi:hypothetical protein